jgi:type IV pilus assembly protein PilE
MKISRKKGFTLLELIIVVIVIGVLASIALPRYIRVVEKGRAAEAKSVLGNMRESQMRYSAQYSAFTGSTTALDLNLQPGRYYTLTAVGGGAIGSDTTVVARATRNTVENPGLGAYVIEIQQGGTISADATGTQFL